MRVLLLLQVSWVRAPSGCWSKSSFEFIFRFLSEPKNIREELRELERVSAMESGGPFFSNAACNALEVNTFTMRRASEAVLELSGSHWQGSLHRDVLASIS